MNLVIAAILGAGLGHAARRATPYLLGMKDKAMPFSYPMVEAIGALSFFLVAFRMGTAPAQWHWLLLAILLLTVSSADAYTKYIPTFFCYVGTILGVITSCLSPNDILDLGGQYRLLELTPISMHDTHLAGAALSVGGAIMGWCLIQFIRRVFRPIVSIEVMGAGDAILMLLIGAFLGPRMVLFSLFPACLVGIAIGGTRMLLTGAPHTAFGPALAAGAMIMVLFGKTLEAGISAFYNFIYNLPPIIPLIFSVFLVLVLLFLLLRLRRKSAEYEKIMDDDYAEIDKKM